MQTLARNKVVDRRQRRLPLVSIRAIALALTAALLLAALFAGEASADSSSPNDQSAPNGLSTSDPTPEPTPEPAPTEASEPESTPATAKSVPAKPTGLETDTSRGSLNVGVTWDAVEGSDDYWIRWRSVDDGAKLNEGVRVESSSSDIVVAAYGEWVVRVQACNDAGCGKPLSQKLKVDAAAEPTPESRDSLDFSSSVDSFEFNTGQDIGTQTLPKATGGAGGFTYTLSPALPEGLSFDAATRALTGTPVEAGEHSMTYTATDADGTQIGATLQIAIRATADAQVKSATTPGKPGTPTLTKTQFTTKTDPALDATWTAPASGATPSGYEAQYREKVADGETANAWTAFTGSVDVANRSLNIPDLTAGATYEVQVRAVNGTEAGLWSDTGSGLANRAPRSTESDNTGKFLTLKWGGDDSVLTLSSKFADDDSDTLTYWATAAFPGVISVGIEGDDSDKLRIHVVNPATSSITYGVSDGYGGFASRTVSVSGSAAALIGADLGRSVAENSAAGTTVGDPVTGKPYKGAALTYSLTGEASTSGAFVIDSASGQISVKQGASLDFETKTSYTGEVKWTVQGQEASADITISVTDAGADKPDTPTVTRTQFSEPTNPALDVTWTAPDVTGVTITGYKVQYRKQVADGETPNAWTAYTYTDGEGNTTSALPASTLNINLPDLDAGATYEAQVHALTNIEGPGPWSDIGSGQANAAPHGTTVVLVDGEITWGLVVYSPGPLSDYFGDGDGDTLRYAVSSQYPGLISAWLTAAPIKLAVKMVNPGPSTITYGAHDGYGGYFSRTMVVTGVSKPTRSVAENSSAGTAVGRAVLGTPVNNQALTYTLTGEAATSGAFVIDSASGQISVKQGATLDYETKSSYTGKVNWTVQGQAVFATLTINVTDIEAGKPDTPTVTRTRFEEESNPALDVTWTAPDSNGTTITGYNAQYRKQVADGETPNAWTAYSYTDSDGNATSKLAASTTSVNLPDLDAGATYEVQVRAVTSDEGEGPWSDTGSGQANRPPVYGGVFLIDITFNRGTTWAPNWTNFRKWFSDSDGDTLTPWVRSEYPGILPAWVVADATTAFRFRGDNQGRVTLHYGAYDGYGGSFGMSVTYTIADQQTREVAENSAAGTAVGDPVTGTPYDDGDDQTDDALTYTLTGEAATSGAFVIDSASGQISVKQGATLDYETKSSYTGKVEYTVQEQAVAIDLTINVTDIEAGKPDTPTVTRTRFEEESNPALDVTWTAPRQQRHDHHRLQRPVPQAGRRR